jgi:rhodanese-related sulfurtransferase
VAREVDLDAFASAWSEGGFVVDVREPEEYQAGHVPGALLVPLAKVPTWIEVPMDRPVYVICASGNRSLAVIDWLRARGVDARSVAGGTRGWAQAGRPLAMDSRPQ